MPGAQLHCAEDRAMQGLLLLIKSLHELLYQKRRNSGNILYRYICMYTYSIVYTGSCRVSIIRSSASPVRMAVLQQGSLNLESQRAQALEVRGFRIFPKGAIASCRLLTLHLMQA